MAKLAARLRRTDLPEVKPGDTVRVQVKITEGDKERIQAFEGTVISKPHACAKSSARWWSQRLLPQRSRNKPYRGCTRMHADKKITA